jgi:hypothetical protein
MGRWCSVVVGIFGEMQTRLHSASAFFLMHKQYSISDVSYGLSGTQNMVWAGWCPRIRTDSHMTREEKVELPFKPQLKGHGPPNQRRCR